MSFVSSRIMLALFGAVAFMLVILLKNYGCKALKTDTDSSWKEILQKYATWGVIFFIIVFGLLVLYTPIPQNAYTQGVAAPF